MPPHRIRQAEQVSRGPFAPSLAQALSNPSRLRLAGLPLQPGTPPASLRRAGKASRQRRDARPSRRAAIRPAARPSLLAAERSAADTRGQQQALGAAGRQAAAGCPLGRRAAGWAAGPSSPPFAAAACGCSGGQPPLLRAYEGPARPDTL